MDNAAKYRKVSELEWFLTMQAYLKNRQKDSTDFSLSCVTIREFHDIYENLRCPVEWDESGKIGFFAPFRDSFVLMPGESMEIPLGFSIDEEAVIVQPAPEKILQSHYRVKGKSEGIGNVLCIANISNDPYEFEMKENRPLCLIDLQTKKSHILDQLFAGGENESPSVMVPVSMEENGVIVRKEIRVDTGKAAELFRRLNSKYVI